MQKGMQIRFTLAATLSVLTLNAYAVAPGFYLGLRTGPATNTSGTQQAQVFNSAATTPAQPRSNQFGTGFFMGYKINQYGGVEGGTDFFTTIHYNTNGVQTCSGTSVRVRDIQFAGKGYYPFGNSFDVFGKAGAAAVYEATSGALNPTNTTTCGRTTYATKIRPVLGIGMSYDLTQSWVADLSWTRLMVGGAAKNVDHYAVGISYHFVDQYCGQFLC